MQTVTCGTAASTPLWRLLKTLQPTLCLASATSVAPPSKPSAMSYSFVVVPPPAPAATSSFEHHLITLLEHVAHPVFVTCTSYSPYFTSLSAERATENSDDERGGDDALSATQKALTFLHRRLPSDTGLVLTITGTRTTTTTAPTENDTASPGGASATTLTGAFPHGVRAVMTDFCNRLSCKSVEDKEDTELASCGRAGGLMVLRGDDGGYTRTRMAAAWGEKKSAAASSFAATAEAANSTSDTVDSNPYSFFKDGAALIRFVSDTRDSSSSQREGQRDTQTVANTVAGVCLFTGGYAQGHVLDRVWGSTDPTLSSSSPLSVSAAVDDATAHSDKTKTSSSPSCVCQTLTSLKFLDYLDKVLADTEAQLRHAQGSHGNPRPPSVETCAEVAAALVARVDAVRQLWLTPSQYSRATRAACARRLIEEKVLLDGSAINASNSSGGGEGGARVVVTQMLASAQEFTEFEADVQRALHDIVTKGSTPSCVSAALVDPALVLVPGLMAPLRGEQFARAALQLKVIPSPPLQSALQIYQDALKSAGKELEKVPADAQPELKEAAVAAFQHAKEDAEVSFQKSMEAFTVELAKELYELGYTHVNFSAFQYGCGDAIGRVVAQLPQ